jgi:hypothetical protein
MRNKPGYPRSNIASVALSERCVKLFAKKLLLVPRHPHHNLPFFISNGLY